MNDYVDIMKEFEQQILRLQITMGALKSALAVGSPCFYFFDDSKLHVYDIVYHVTSKRPLFDNGHPVPELNPSDKDSIEHMLKDSGVPLGQGYYVILK